MVKLRTVRLGEPSIAWERRADGVLMLQSKSPLKPYPTRYTERLEHWAKVAPDHIFLAERDSPTSWRTFTYAEAYDAVRRLAQAFIDRGISAERPVLILSGNSIEHALIGLAAMHMGAHYCPLSTGYSLLSTDFARLKHALNVLTPGLIFVQHGMQFQRAIDAAIPDTIELVVKSDPIPGRKTTPFQELARTEPTAAVEAAARTVTGDTVGKILFTSGSSAMPKGVMNTHRLLCSNAQAHMQVWPLFEHEPAVILDWAPWNHTLGTNAVFGTALFSGASLYIDSGKPTPEEIGKTVANLADTRPHAFFGVPLVYQLLLPYLEHDKDFRRRFFSRMKFLFYAGATLPQRLWDGFRAAGIEATGERIFTTSALGATETGPTLMAANWDADQPGVLGLPVPGVLVKLVPRDGRLEVRAKGPSITPGYWRQPELTAKALDDEGFYCMGDAVKFVDPDDFSKGLLFDGRLSEDFKMLNAAWVNVGPLRTLANGHLSPLSADVIVTGQDREELGLLIFPEFDNCRRLAGLPDTATITDILDAPVIVDEFKKRLETIAAHGTSTTNRITRAILVETPASEIEMTDKKTLSHNSVLQKRAAEVDALYRSASSKRVILVDTVNRPALQS